MDQERYSVALSVDEYLNHLSDQQKHECFELVALFEDVTGQDAVMWGPSIIGFGEKDPDSHPECAKDGLEIGFALRPRKIILHLRRYADHYHEYLAELGDVLVGKACISFESLEHINRDALRRLLEFAWADRSRA